MAAGRITKTGACYDGFHETSFSDDGMTPKMICRGIVPISVGVNRQFVCGCKCHVEITEFYALAGRERVWPESQFSPQRRAIQEDNWRSWGLDQILRGGKAKQIVVLPENHDAPAEIVTVTEMIDSGQSIDISAQLPPHPAKIAPTTDSKRVGRAPGQLEFEVKIACDQFVLGLAGDTELGLGALAISRLVDPVRPPSTGAVTNILMAWRSIGFATIQEGPWRFMGYTRAGVQLGIAPLRQRFDADQVTKKRRNSLDKRNSERSESLTRAQGRNSRKK